MNDNDLRLAARRLAAINRRNKLTIQRKRTKFATTKASIEQLPRPTSFTRYKYG